MTRYRIGKINIYETGGTLIMPVMSKERQRNKMVAIILSVICLVAVYYIGTFALFHKHWVTDTQLVTSLPPNLDDQSPSITIYGGN